MSKAPYKTQTVYKPVWLPIWILEKTIEGTAKILSAIDNKTDRKRKQARPIQTFNCARVHIGEYDNGQTNEFFDVIRCGYSVERGAINFKRIRPIAVKGFDGNGDGKTYLLQTVVLYSKTDEAIIAISSRKESRNIRLVKHYTNTKITMYKMRL